MAVFKGGTRTKMINYKSTVKGNQWLRNALKSSRSLGNQLVREMVPTIYEAGSSALQEAQMLKDTFGASQNKSTLESLLSNNPAIAQIKKGFGNIKEDLKIGNLNNTAREDQNFESQFDMDFSGWDSDFNDMDSDLPYSETEQNPQAGAKFVTVNNNMDTDLISKSLLKTSNSIAKNMSTVAKANYSMSIATIQAINKSTLEMTSGMRAMNENLSSLVKFNSISMTKYVDASLQYYNDSIAILKKLEQQQASLGGGNNAPPYMTKSQQAQRGLANQFNMKDLKTILSGNKSNALASLGLGGGGMMLQQLVSNPLGFGLMLFLMLMPKNVGRAAASMDKMFKNFGTGMMMKSNQMKDRYDNPFIMALGEMFGLNVKRKKNVNISKFHKGPTPFDGETKKAIVDVIPTYLRKILATLSGDEEMLFDYKSGRFRSHTKARKDIQDQMKNAELGGFSDILNEIRRYIQDVQFQSRKAQEQFMDEVKGVFLEMSRSDKLVKMHKGPNDSLFDQSMQDIMLMNMTAQNKRLFESIWKKLPKATKANAAVSGVIGGRNNLTDLLNEWEAGANGSSLPELLEGMKSSDFKPIGKRKGGFLGGTLKDTFGNTQIDYLRNIQEILRGGIRVFNTKGKPKHLSKYKLKASSDTVDSYETSYEPLYMNSKHDPSSMSDDELNSMMKGITAKKNTTKSPTLQKWANSNNKFLKGLSKVLSKPANIMTSAMDKLTEGMYGILFGFEDEDGNPDGSSIMGKISNGISNIFTWIKDNIFTKLHDFLFDKDKGLFGIF